MNEQVDITASGGAVVRSRSDGVTEVLVVHRPKYDDWSLPKGKEENGESPTEAAVREVLEETGYRARIVDRLPDVHYQTHAGLKLVRYFIMRPVANGKFTPGDEVDEVRWVTLEEAEALLSYDHDRSLVRDERLGPISRTGSIYLVRHAHAGNRSKWDGDDADRPLTDKGHRQAEALAADLAIRGTDRILTSHYARCRQTVEPLAEMLGLELENHPLLAEGADARGLVELIGELAGTDTVMSSHGDVIPAVLDRLARDGVALHTPDGVFDCKKGSIWEVRIEDGVASIASYSKPPPTTS